MSVPPIYVPVQVGYILSIHTVLLGLTVSSKTVHHTYLVTR